MPVLHLKYDMYKVPWHLLEKLKEELPSIVTTALDVPDNPEARLTPTDIELWFEKVHVLDANTKDLRILIFAHDYPERRENLQDRINEITTGLRAILGEKKVTGWVWVHLNTTAFEQI